MNFFFLLNKCLYFRIIFFSYLNFFHVCNCLNTTAARSSGNAIDKYDLGKYVASIQLKLYPNDNSQQDSTHLCGGTIIDERRILTTARCLRSLGGQIYNPDHLVVIVGMRNRFVHDNYTRIMEVASLQIRKSFRSSSAFYGGIGIVSLKNRIVFDNDQTAIIKLPESAARTGQLCTVVGWGELFEDKQNNSSLQKGSPADELMFMDLTILPEDYCLEKYGREFSFDMVCAGDPWTRLKGHSTGDPGGHLVCNHAITGLVSWDFSCGRPYYPGVYVDVFYYKSWILRGGGNSSSNRLVFVFFLISLIKILDLI